MVRYFHCSSGVRPRRILQTLIAGAMVTVGLAVYATPALAVKALVQLAPTSSSSTVMGSVAFGRQLAVTGNTGVVSFSRTSPQDHLTVSEDGSIATTGLLLPGRYTIEGKTSDASGDDGSFAFDLVVGTITQVTAPNGSSTVTRSAAFIEQLAVTGNNGATTYARTSADDHLTVSSSGSIATTGTLSRGRYSASGITSDLNGDNGRFIFTLVVGAITQVAPAITWSTVTKSSTAGFQLAVLGNDGDVTFTRTSANDHLRVSASGLITTTGTLSAGRYFAAGTMRDPNGDNGIFTFALVVATVTIVQVAPIRSSLPVVKADVFERQLAVTGNNGAVVYSRTSAFDHLTVSASGLVAAASRLDPGFYVVSGSTRDADGDRGRFAFFLIVHKSSHATGRPRVF
jgi:hypothetical protein